MANATTARVAQLNDQVRAMMGMFGRLGGQLVTTRGFAARPDEIKAAVFGAVQTFDGFTKANDPYGERDFGSIEAGGETYFWKIDYYDTAMRFHSPDKADPAVTTRVLTIMLAEEY